MPPRTSQSQPLALVAVDAVRIAGSASFDNPAFYPSILSPSPFSPPSLSYHQKRDLSAIQLSKRAQTCSVDGNGNAFVCPDYYRCVGDKACVYDSDQDRDGFFYGEHRRGYWWGIGVGTVVVLGLIAYLVWKRVRRAGYLERMKRGEHQQEPWYGHSIPMEPSGVQIIQPSPLPYIPPSTPPPAHVASPRRGSCDMEPEDVRRNGEEDVYRASVSGWPSSSSSAAAAVTGAKAARLEEPPEYTPRS
jgi:hypothetical protein